MKLRDFTIGIGAQVDNKSMNLAERTIGGLKTKMLGLATVAGLGGIAVGIKAMTDRMANLGDSALETAKSLNVPLELLQEMQLAGELEGIEKGGMTNALKFLGRNMKQAAEGGKVAQDAFNSLGVSVTDSSGKLRPMGDVLADVADGITKLEEGKKLGATLAIFGRGSLKMSGLLDKGSDAINRMRDEARKTGAVIDEETAQKMSEYNDAWKQLDNTWTGIKIGIANKLLEPLTKLANYLTNQGLPKLKEFTNTVLELSIDATKLVVGIGGIIVGLAMLETAFIGAGNTALLAYVKMLALPLLIGAGIVVLGLIAEDVWTGMTKDISEVDSVTGRLIATMKTEFPTAFKVVSGAFKTILYPIFHTLTLASGGLTSLLGLLTGSDRLYKTGLGMIDMTNKAFGASLNDAFGSNNYADETATKTNMNYSTATKPNMDYSSYVPMSEISYKYNPTPSSVNNSKTQTISLSGVTIVADNPQSFLNELESVIATRGGYTPALGGAVD